MNNRTPIEALVESLKWYCKEGSLSGRWRIYFDAKVLTFKSPDNTYKSYNIAKNAVRMKFYYFRNEVDQLISNGRIEIKQIP